MKNRKEIVKVLKTALPLLCSAGLIWWLFSKINFHQVEAIMHQDVHYSVFIPVMIIIVLSHSIRGYRWGIQLRAAGIGDVPLLTLCTSIYGAYALNLVVPFMGEGWRIYYIAHRQKAPVSTVLGTDIGDRLSDAAVVLVLSALTLIVGHRYILAFMDHYTVGARIAATLQNSSLWFTILGALATIAATLWLARRTPLIKKLTHSLRSVWHGFAVLFTMKGRGMYLILTIGIWLCFYLETYLSFYAFPFTRTLIQEPGMAFGLLPALVSFVFSSLSMIIPSNGGLGPWNLAVMFALSLFGIANADGATFSIVLWSTLTITLILLGIFTIAYIMRTRKHPTIKA